MLEKTARKQNQEEFLKNQTKKNDYSIGAIGEKLCLTHNTDELLENREPTIDFPMFFRTKKDIKT